MIIVLLFGIFLLLLSLVLILLMGRDMFLGLLIWIGIILGLLLVLGVAGIAFMIFIMPKLEEQGISLWSAVGGVAFLIALVWCLPWIISSYDNAEKVGPEQLRVHSFRGGNYVQATEFLSGDRGVNEWEEKIGRKIAHKVGPMHDMVTYSDWQEYLRYRHRQDEG